MAKKYKIWDNINKSFVYDKKTGTFENGYRDMTVLEFSAKKKAEQWKEEWLCEGNYCDYPSSVLQVI